MSRRLLIGAFFLVVSFHLHGQDGETEEGEKEKVVKITIPNATLKVNIPVLLIDPKHAFFISTDTRIRDNLSLDMGVGYYFWLNNRAIYQDEKFNGLRGRVGIKYFYVFGRRLAPYVGLEGMLNRFNIEEYEEVCRFGCQYQEQLLVNREVKASGVAARTGLMIFLGKEKRFFFDVYGGVGFKYMEISTDLPSDADDLFTDGFFFENLYDSDPGDYYVPNIILGVHFGYAFW